MNNTLELIFPLLNGQDDYNEIGINIILHPTEENCTEIYIKENDQKAMIYKRDFLKEARGEWSREGIKEFADYFNSNYLVNINRNKYDLDKTNLHVKGHIFWALHDLVHLTNDICAISKKDKIYEIDIKDFKDKVYLIIYEESNRFAQTLSALAAIRASNILANNATLAVIDKYFDDINFMDLVELVCQKNETLFHKKQMALNLIETSFGVSNEIFNKMGKLYNNIYSMACALDRKFPNINNIFERRINYLKQILEVK